MDIDKKIVIALELGTGDDEVSQQIIENTKSIIDRRLVLAVDEILTDQQRVEFETVRQTQDTVSARLWLEKNVVNTQELYQSLLDDYLAEKRSLLGK